MTEWVHTSPKLDLDFVQTVEESLRAAKLSKRRLKVGLDANMMNVEYRIPFDNAGQKDMFRVLLENKLTHLSRNPRPQKLPQRLRRRRPLVPDPTAA